MNRKGDTPTILLFIVTLILVVVALFSFVSFKGNFSDNSDRISFVLERAQFEEKFLIEESKFMMNQVIVNNWGKEELKKLEAERVFFGGFSQKIQDGDFVLEKDFDGNYLFVVEDIFMGIGTSGNELKRSFDLKMVFDSSGNLKSYEKVVDSGNSKGEPKS